MWRFLGVLVALQLYFVRELLAAFALFALAFAAIAFVIVSLYMLQKSWELAVARVADSNHPVVNFARRGVSAVEDMHGDRYGGRVPRRRGQFNRFLASARAHKGQPDLRPVGLFSFCATLSRP